MINIDNLIKATPILAIVLVFAAVCFQVGRTALRQQKRDAENKNSED